MGNKVMYNMYICRNVNQQLCSNTALWKSELNGATHPSNFNPPPVMENPLCSQRNVTGYNLGYGT